MSNRDDEAAALLTTAMRVLEEHMTDGEPVNDATLMLWRVHSMVQRAWSLHVGHRPAIGLSPDTQAFLVDMATSDAIENARWAAKNAPE